MGHAWLNGAGTLARGALSGVEKTLPLVRLGEGADPGGVWEVNVAPMGRELAEDHAPSKAGRRKGSKKQEQLGTSGGLVSTQL